jgi:hypothetical protein
LLQSSWFVKVPQKKEKVYLIREGTMEKNRSPGQMQGLSSKFTEAKGRVSKELSSQSSIRGQKMKEPAIPIKRVKKQTKITRDKAEFRETFGKANLLEQHHMVKIRAFNMGSSTSQPG